MTDDERDILAEAERIINDADAKHRRDSLTEHQQAVKLFAGFAKGFVTPSYITHPYDSNVHVFMVRPDPTASKEDAVASITSPGSNTDDEMPAAFQHVHAFDDVGEAVSCLQDMKASIILHETIGKETPFGLFMSVKDKWFALWVGNKLTVASRAGSDFTLKSTDMADVGDSPKEFFDGIGCPSKTAMAITAMMFFHSAARLFEHSMPETYGHMAKQVMSMLEDDS